jgi:type I site-specific restriction endonuclease
MVWEEKAREYRQRRENMIGAIVKAAHEHPAGVLVVMKTGAKTRLARMMQCALPGCQKVSLKDYCCAEHCRKHKEMRRAK